MSLARRYAYTLRSTARSLACVFLTALVACSGGGGGTGTALGNLKATMISIEITPTNPQLAAGTTTQFTATAILSDSTHQNVTSQVTWASSNTQTATVSKGLATGVTAGSATITATLGNMTAHTTLSVTPALLVAIEVTPPTPSIAKGTTAQFTATGVFSDKSTQNLTSQVSWVSSNPAVATVSSMTGSSGLASATGVGSAQISASLHGITSPGASLTVTAATLVSIQVNPPTSSIANGLTQQFTATGVYTDNSTQNVTSLVTWVSSDTSVVAISNTAGSMGLASSVGLGSTSIIANLGAVTSPGVSLTVTPATLVSIQVNPPIPSIANGLTQQFTATGVYTDNSTQDLTTTVTWVSANANVATISNGGGTNGIATSAGLGTSAITATLGTIVSPAVTLTVTPATLVSIQVNPPTPSIANGLTQQFTATGLYTDNSTQDLTGSVTWASANGAVASISTVGGLATALSVGSSSITAASGAVISTAVTLTVTPATLVSIAVAPTSASIAKGSTQQFTATGTYTDSSTQDLTKVVTWASATGSVASISNAAGSNGLATALGAGSTNISAAYSGVTSPNAVLTVVAAVATAGIWTATPAAGTTAFMISDAAGNIYYYTSTSTCMALSDASLTLTGSTVSGAGYTMPDVFGPKTTCAPEVHETFTGTLVPSESMQLTSKPTGGGGSSSTINWTFDPIYFQPSALSLVAGSWTMADGTKVTVSSSGAISGQDTTTGCTITGTLSVGNTAVDVYSVTVRYTLCNGSAGTALNGVTLTGLGMLNTSVSPSQFTALVQSANGRTMSILSWQQ